jgi:hypothetical protein
MRWLVLVFSSLVLVSCTTGNDSFCSSICARFTACNATSDPIVCTNKCNSDNAFILSKLRSDVVQSMQSCIQAKDCKTIRSQNAISSCLKEAWDKAAASAAVERYCNNYAAAATKCGGRIDISACVISRKIFSDEALTDATGCTKKTCSSIDSCVSATFAIEASDTPLLSDGGGTGNPPTPDSGSGSGK